MQNIVAKLLQKETAVIMGIVNVTPDSFSDGGQFETIQAAVEHGLELVEQGAQIIDIGGESTRPGANQVSLQQELDRVIPIVENLRQKTSVPISIDTYKPQVMREAISAGAEMVNDINALRAEGAQAVVAETGVPVCLMHMQGEPHNMQSNPDYNDVITEVGSFLQNRINSCLEAGIERTNIILDPGIGFGKTLHHNLLLLKQLPALIERLGCKMLIGVSRKSLIDKALNREVDQRLAASLGLAVQAVINGANIVRVHDVQATNDAIRMIEAVANASR